MRARIEGFSKVKEYPNAIITPVERIPDEIKHFK
jgi:hypothetical protein